MTRGVFDIDQYLAQQASTRDRFGQEIPGAWDPPASEESVVEATSHAQLATDPQNPYVFVLIAFEESWSDQVHAAISAACKSVSRTCEGLEWERADDIARPGRITDQIIASIRRADAVIADVTVRNANVMFELGFAHALGVAAIVINQKVADAPFDMKDWRAIGYPNRSVEDAAGGNRPLSRFRFRLRPLVRSVWLKEWARLRQLLPLGIRCVAMADTGGGNLKAERKFPWVFPLSKGWSTLLWVLLILAPIGLTVWGILGRWSSSQWLAVSGLVVSIAGFTVAIVEIRGTRTEAQATRMAVRKTLKAVAAARLNISITQMRQLVPELEKATDGEDPEGVRSVLNDWRHLGTDASGLIEQRFGAGDSSLAPLERSVRLASEAKARIFDLGEDGDVRAALGDAVDAMNKAVDAVGPLLARIQPTMEEIDGG